ncbi:MAG: hypothetical protein CMF49_08960 [Legionellales bacterium]|nr:hypothetical protein [Legionellales bacterium]|tara:strand:- start:97 stop:1737 length:1641 start_codon:yes stop_codon:yes gene_type:complete
MTNSEVPVLIVGAGPVGLSAAMSLVRLGITVLVVEKHPSLSTHPKARGINIRTMELMRLWQVEQMMRRHELPEEAKRFVWAYDFQDKNFISIEKAKEDKRYSPTISAIVSQDWVESELLEALMQYPNFQITFSTALTEFTYNDNGIVATLKHRTTDSEQQIFAKYMIAADGAHSFVRKQLGVDMHGAENLGNFCSIYCEVDLTHLIKDKLCAVMVLTSPELRRCVLMSVDGARKWVFSIRYLEQEGYTQEYFTREKCIELIRKIIGDENIPIQLINRNFWTMAALNAERYTSDNIFLVGDAAHRLPPTGGFGMNTGIQDSHNLAWKIAYVLKGWADASILQSYQVERSAIAQANIDWSSHNAERLVKIFTALEAGDITTAEKHIHSQHQHVNNLGLDIGFVYKQGLFIEEKKSRAAKSVEVETYQPSGEPGARAPHVVLQFGHKTLSTLDLFEQDYVFLTMNPAWEIAVDSINSQLNHPVKYYLISSTCYHDINHAFLTCYQLEQSGAVLVRPDGHIAWHMSQVKAVDEHYLIDVVQQLGLCIKEK